MVSFAETFSGNASAGGRFSSKYGSGGLYLGGAGSFPIGIVCGDAELEPLMEGGWCFAALVGLNTLLWLAF